jgi:hypothetical protein
MDIKLLTELISLIKPNEVYEFSFPTKTKDTKKGIDWRGTFISLNRQIQDKDGKKLIEFFKNPIKETTQEVQTEVQTEEIIKPKKNKK